MLRVYSAWEQNWPFLVLKVMAPTARHAQLIEQLQRAGVAVVFIDFRLKPIVNTPKSIALLGKVLGRKRQAQMYNAFYQQQLQRVHSRIADFTQSAAPEVFIHSRVGVQDLCCETMTRGMIAALVDIAQGSNVAVDLVPGNTGVVNLEYLLQRQPDIYIATAIGSTRYQSNEEVNNLPYIILGAGIDQNTARQSFRNAIKTQQYCRIKRD